MTIGFPSRWSMSASSSERFGSSCTPRADAIAATIEDGMPAGASATKRTVSRESLRARATFNAVCVLPTPPAPVSVTSRCSRTSPSISRTSVSRPTKLVSAIGRSDGAGAARPGCGDPPHHALARGGLELAAPFFIEFERLGEER